MRHDYPSLGNRLNLSYFRDRKQVLRILLQSLVPLLQARISGKSRGNLENWPTYGQKTSFGFLVKEWEVN